MKNTFQEIADELFPHISSGTMQMKEEIINTLLNIIEANEYQNVANFEWLFTNLKLLILQCPPSCEKRLANIIKVSTALRFHATLPNITIRTLQYASKKFEQTLVVSLYILAS